MEGHGSNTNGIGIQVIRAYRAPNVRIVAVGNWPRSGVYHVRARVIVSL